MTKEAEDFWMVRDTKLATRILEIGFSKQILWYTWNRKTYWFLDPRNGLGVQSLSQMSRNMSLLIWIGWPKRVRLKKGVVSKFIGNQIQLIVTFSVFYNDVKTLGWSVWWAVKAKQGEIHTFLISSHCLSSLVEIFGEGWLDWRFWWIQVGSKTFHS